MSFYFLNFDAEIESYMNKIICERRAKKLNSISIAHGYCFLGERHIFIEELTATCVVVFYQMRELLKNIVIEKNHKKYLFFINIMKFG